MNKQSLGTIGAAIALLSTVGIMPVFIGLVVGFMIFAAIAPASPLELRAFGVWTLIILIGLGLWMFGDES